MRTLRLTANGIGEKGARALARCPTLRELSLAGNAVGKAVDELAKMTSLERLELGGAKIDKTSRVRLRESLPGCVLDFDD